MTTCSACQAPIVVAMVLAHRGREWSLCRRCYFQPPVAPAPKRGKR